jgi:ATP-dependent RNA helicase RhlE
MSFDDFALHQRVAAGVRAVGYTTPTPIQEQAIPAVLAGRDVLGLAQTGTGKTAAFALPILHRLMDGPRRRTRALVVAPTRELAEQIHDAFTDLGQATGVRSATVYGGVGMNPQIQALRRGTEVIVACPGRLLDLMQQGHGDFGNLEVLVLDEADHMFDMGFLPDIRRLLAQLPRERQSLLFSATMPADVRTWSTRRSRDPVTVAVHNDNRPVETVEHALYPVEPHLKTTCSRRSSSAGTRAACWCSPAPSTAPSASPSSSTGAASSPPTSRATSRSGSGRTRSTASGAATSTCSWPPTSRPAAST